MSAEIRMRQSHRAFGGRVGFYEHESALLGGSARFSVFLPGQGAGPFPAVYFLAGLTCTEETAMMKSCALAHASELGLAFVTLDTSPRTARYEGDADHWDFGVGAGFYVDATEAPWSATYKMASYVTDELRLLVERTLPIASDRRGITGHSMGGHGALTLALRNPGLYRSVSAFAPIVAPSKVPWGQKAFERYLGSDVSKWQEHDACALLESGRAHRGTILIDQGQSDAFLERELQPERLARSAAIAGQSIDLRLREGYDHSYYFIASFIGEHLRFHAEALR